MTDPKSIANVFNNYFANIGSNLASSIPNVGKAFYEYMPLPARDSIFVSPVTDEEIVTRKYPNLQLVRL